MIKPGMDIVRSKNGVPIRLTERWIHITDEHREPEAIYEGKAGELLAAREVEPGKMASIDINRHYDAVTVVAEGLQAKDDATITNLCSSIDC